ncbi:Asp-tRNA(Asn)/Glu-tRNA(Gln) amidotransferase subunit GatA [Patescibacteria group bacterium]|nr:Asp-tRNA(Asn)/Glu-tRNA(Gln) amidotransferase subunit GatA [Patescibacteria group bacterium]
MTVKDMRKGLNAGDFSSVELTEHFLKNAKNNKNLNAYLEIFDDAVEHAKAADVQIKGGKAMSLTGIPIALKDNILIKGKTASAGSKILENYTATYDAFVVEKLKDQGAVLIGRTNMDEFAMGSSTENSAFAITRNPYDKTRVPGGSSGGSTAAVASNSAALALGSDTAGSIRQPAAFCGVVGLKPTYGSVSRSGLIAMGSSLDVIGPIGKCVDDVEIAYNAIRGKDKADSTTIDDTTFDIPEVSNKMTIGVPRDFVSSDINPNVLEKFEKTLDALKACGHTIKDITLPYLKYSLASYYIIMPAEASTNLARIDGMRYGFHLDGDDLLGDYKNSRGEGFGREVRRRILLGAHVLSSGYYDAYYGKATAVRRFIKEDFEKAFRDVDVIATPTTPTPAFKIGEKADPLSMYLEDIFTVPANIVGIPGISVPIETIEEGGSNLPVGFQMVAPLLGEERLFKLGKVVESF